VIAAAWATLLAMGEDGYLRNAETVLRVTRQFIDGINAIEGLRVLGDPPVGVFAYTAKDPALSLYAIADQMAAKGWHIDRQQKPASIHLMINPGHAEIVDTYLADLREAVDYVRAHPEAAASGSAPAYGLIANAPLRGLVASNVLAMMERLYSAEGQLPALEAGAEGGPAASLPKPVQWLMKLKARFGHRS
jgi:hypothetical protein